MGGTAGAALATAAPLYMSGNVWYVGPGGTDAAAPRGKERIRPLATIGQALTNASAGDIIVCLQSYTESLSAVQTVSKAGLLIIGEGSGSARPTITRATAANFVAFDVTAAGVWIWNIKFAGSTGANTSARIQTAAAGTVVRECYIESSANDTGPGFAAVTGAGTLRIVDTTFISSASTPASQPESAVKVSNAISDFDLDTVTIDGGSSGWSNPYAFDGAAAITRLRALNVDLLNDSDVTLATGTTGYMTVRNDSGSARVVWTA